MPAQSRQLAAIMFTDIVGYTALMGKDEENAMQLLDQNRALQKPLIEEYRGRYLKEIGDGVLASFNSAGDAVSCAFAIQKALSDDQELTLRIGIHLGDITFKDEDVFGDGVNIAARIQAITDPGGIYITESIHKAIRGRGDIQAQYLGETQLKNVDYLVKIYALQGVGLPVPKVGEDKELSGHFWAEVQRRSMIRAAVAYMVTGLFLVLLLREIQNWIALPDWSLTAALASLLVCFPIAIYLAWNYERSPEGFVRTSSQQSWQNPYSTSKKKPLTSNFIIVGLILVILIMYLYPRYLSTMEVTFDDKSIAVIPFVDMSPEGDHEWFSDGISEELLNALVRIPNLKVVGRTSSWTYKGVTNKDLKAIGKELGVGTILEGSVRKSGTNIRITAQLVNTEDGFHLWSHTYDRELTDIFAVQDEITAAIVDAMSVHLIDEAVSLKPTANINAYTIYLQARQKLASRGIENLIEARRLFEEAIRLDPDYDPAYSGLARAISLFPTYSTKYSGREIVGPAKDAATKAIDLNSKNSEAFSVLGFVATFHEWDWKTGEEAFNKSVELSNDDAEIFNFIGDYYQVVLHPTLAIEMESRALELDPLNPVNHSDLSRAYALIGDWENALRYAKSAQSLSVHHTTTNLVLVYLDLDSLEEAENAVAELYDKNIDYFSNFYYKTIMAIAKGESDIALSYIELMVNTAEKPIYLSSFLGRFYLDLGMLDEAANWLEKAYDNREYELVFPFRPSGFTLPEDLPDHPALQAALDKPELNALFEIRRKNLGLSNESL